MFSSTMKRLRVSSGIKRSDSSSIRASSSCISSSAADCSILCALNSSESYSESAKSSTRSNPNHHNPATYRQTLLLYTLMRKLRSFHLVGTNTQLRAMIFDQWVCFLTKAHRQRFGERVMRREEEEKAGRQAKSAVRSPHSLQPKIKVNAREQTVNETCSQSNASSQPASSPIKPASANADLRAAKSLTRRKRAHFGEGM